MLYLSLLSLLAPLASFQTVTDETAPPNLEIQGQDYTRLERQANVFTKSSQHHAVLAETRGGDLVVVWQSRRQEVGHYGIYARRFDASGQVLGGEIHVNTTTVSMQMLPSITVDDQGGVWIAWRSFRQDGDQGSIIARRFDPRFKTATAEVLVNEKTSGEQTDVVLAALPNGHVLCIWSTPGAGDGTVELHGRRLGPDGKAAGEEFVVSRTDDGRDTLASAAHDSDGKVALAFARTGADGRSVGIFVQRLQADEETATGVRVVGDAVRVDEAGGIEPSLAVGTGGSMVVAWFEAESNGYGIRMRRMSTDDGELELGGIHSVEVEEPGYSSGLAVALDEAGNTLLAWSRFGDGPKNEAGLFAQHFDSQLNPTGDAFRVTATSAGKQILVAATGSNRLVHHADGRMAFAWWGNADLGDSSGANLTLLIPSGVQIASQVTPSELSFTSMEDIAAPHEPPTFDPKMREPAEVDIRVSRASGDIDFLAVTNTGWTPPDPHMAVGTNHVVVMTNGEIAFFTKAGANTFRDLIQGGSGFWGSEGATNFVFDPEVIWDPHTQRFMAMANERSSSGAQHGFYLLAISDDADPNGNWHKYRIDASPTAGGDDIDSPNIAVDATTIYLTADFFSPSRLHVLMLDKSSVINGGVPAFNTLVVNGSQSHGIPVVYDTGVPAQYMVGFNFGSSNILPLFAITDPLGTPSVQTFGLTVPSYSHPEDPPQAGTSVRPETFEARFWSAVYRNGSLWATHHVNGGRVRQRWYEIDMQGWPTSGSTPTLVQSGEIDLGGDHRTYFGSIWVDTNGVMSMTYARSAPNEFISMEHTWRAPTDPPGTTRPGVNVVTSNGPDSSGRWGDYSAIGSDPAEPGRFWAHHEYRTSSWRTRVAGYMTTLPGTAVFRNDTGATNPTGYSAAPPVIGTTWNAIVDNTGLNNTAAGVFAYLAPLEILIPAWGDYLLIDISDPAGEALSLPAKAGVGPVAFSLAVPPSASLVGTKLFSQGASFGGSGGVRLHNAVDLTVGGF